MERAERMRTRLQEAVGDTYQLLDQLGRGGMGIVFRAYERALDREVALKVLAIEPGVSPEAYARFEREAKLAARLDHPHIVPIFAVGQRKTVAYYAMRLVRGGTLEGAISGHTALVYGRALGVLRDVASALDYAHGQGVIHRDIKPGNVLIGDSGHAMVSDFGIARPVALGTHLAASASRAGVVGSPGYMAPEQWRGEELGPQADQYALGVMAFEMLTGHRPFETVQVQDLMRLHLTAEVPSASMLRAALPPHIDGAIRRSMAKIPSGRFRSASAFVDALGGQRPTFSTRTSAPIVVERSSAEAAIGTWTGIGVIAAAALLAVVVTKARVIRSDSSDNATGTPRSTATAPAVTSSPSPAAATDSMQNHIGVTVRRTPVSFDTTLYPGRALASRANRDAPAYIQVITRGGTAKVRVDGGTYGFSPLVVRVEPGRHYVSLEGAGDAFLPSQLTLQTVANDTTPAVFSARILHGPGDTGDSSAGP
jgi:serine/threonine protein kinase